MKFKNMVKKIRFWKYGFEKYIQKYGSKDLFEFPGGISTLLKYSLWSVRMNLKVLKHSIWRIL